MSGTRTDPSAPAANYPARGSGCTQAQRDDLLTTLNTWWNDRGDRLVQLDERAALHATDRQRSDVAIAFVVWQAVGARRDEIAAVSWRDRNAADPQVPALVWTPVADRTGSPLANDLPEAVLLVDQLLRTVSSDLDSSEVSGHRRLELRRGIDADLTVADRLSGSLGDQVRATAELRCELDALAASGATAGAAAGATTQAAPDPELIEADWSALATAATVLRRNLEATDAERTSMLALLAGARTKLAALTETEAQARAVAADCVENFTDPPALAIPSVAAVDVPAASVTDQPWPQARPTVQGFLTLVDRVERALDVVLRTYGDPRRQRDDLRGLLQAYRDKADALGRAEEPEVDSAYRLARDVLWTAPCDLARARSLTDDYQRIVNTTSTMTDAGETP